MDLVALGPESSNRDDDDEFELKSRQAYRLMSRLTDKLSEKYPSLNLGTSETDEWMTTSSRVRHELRVPRSSKPTLITSLWDRYWGQQDGLLLVYAPVNLERKQEIVVVRDEIIIRPHIQELIETFRLQDKLKVSSSVLGKYF